MKNALIFFALFLTQSIFAQDYASVTYEERNNIGSLGASNTFIGDFNGNGIIEIAVSSGNSNGSFIESIEYNEFEYKRVSYSPDFNSPITWMEYHEDQNSVYVSLENGRIMEVSYDE